MHWIIFYIIVSILNIGSFATINKRNALAAAAQNAYEQKAYRKSDSLYQELLQLKFLSEPAIQFNAAHAAFLAKNFTRSKKLYGNLSRNPTYQSVAFHQLGVIASYESDNSQALVFFKDALILAQKNNDSRYNYEYLKKRESLQKHENTPIPRQSQVVQSTEKEAVLPSSPPPQISREKALQILDAMRAGEKSIFFSLPKKGKTKNIEQDW